MKKLEKLIELSKCISDLCINEKVDNGIGVIIDHHLPLKNNKEDACLASNWDLPEEVTKMVQKNQEELYKYASKITSKYYDNVKLDDNIEEILPSWIVFPYYPGETICWRMGLGEEYDEVFHAFFHTHSYEDLIKYIDKYPVPKYMETYGPYPLYENVKRVNKTKSEREME